MSFSNLAKRALHRLGLHISRWPRLDVRRTGRYPFLSHATHLIQKHDIHFNILDAGAGGRLDDFVTMISALPAGRMTIHGFEVDAAECERMNAVAKASNSPNRFYPVGLWSTSGQQVVHFTKEPDGSSVYPPNAKVVSRWRHSFGKHMGVMLSVQRHIPIAVTSIDEWRRGENIPPLDFMKLNVQAAELEILRGAEASLADVLGLQLEMTFQNTYEGAPFFSDIDPLLRKHGFVLFDMLSVNLVGRNSSPIDPRAVAWQQSFRWPSKQVLEGLFLYLRDPISDPVSWPVERVLKLAVFAELYGQVEYTLELLDWLSRREELDQNDREMVLAASTKAIAALSAC